MVMGEMARSCDVAIVGGGPAGYMAGIRLGALGKDTVLVDSDVLGGVCLNHGCIPSKALIHMADLAWIETHFQNTGMTCSGTVDWKKIQAFKSAVVEKLAKGVELLLKRNGVEVVKGRAFFESSRRLGVETEKGLSAIEFRKAVIATGSRAVEVSTLPFDGKTVVSSRKALDWVELPRSLVVVGGGYIGVELGSMFAKLGTKVSLVETNPGILHHLDRDVVEPVERELEKDGITFYMNAHAKKVEVKKGKARVSIEQGGKSQELEAEKVLVAVGRKPNTDNIGLEKTKVERDERGYIKVNAQQQTSDEHIYAIGDVVAGRPLLAHKGYHEGRIVADVLAGNKAAYDVRAVPSVIFSAPPVASVGPTEKELQAQGRAYVVGKFPYAALGRALATEQAAGFVKVLADKETHEILAWHIVSDAAPDLIGEAALSVEAALFLEDIARTIHVHPTMTEALQEAAEDALGQAPHLLPKRKAMASGSGAREEKR